MTTGIIGGIVILGSILVYWFLFREDPAPPVKKVPKVAPKTPPVKSNPELERPPLNPDLVKKRKQSIKEVNVFALENPELVSQILKKWMNEKKPGPDSNRKG